AGARGRAEVQAGEEALPARIAQSVPERAGFTRMAGADLPRLHLLPGGSAGGHPAQGGPRGNRFGAVPAQVEFEAGVALGFEVGEAANLRLVGERESSRSQHARVEAAAAEDPREDGGAGPGRAEDHQAAVGDQTLRALVEEAGERLHAEDSFL